jgi:DNA-3-methyladenine glycosylase
MDKRLTAEFFRRDVLTVAPELVGKMLVRNFIKGHTERYMITETEAYSGYEDRACHASRGKTPRTEVMFRQGGLVYVYLIYGIYWMLNIVTGEEGEGSAVLIRGIKGLHGPGRVGKILQMDKTFYGENLTLSDRIWIEDAGVSPGYECLPRVGINYAGEPWISIPWRFMASEHYFKMNRS